MKYLAVVLSFAAAFLCLSQRTLAMVSNSLGTAALVHSAAGDSIRLLDTQGQTLNVAILPHSQLVALPDRFIVVTGSSYAAFEKSGTMWQMATSRHWPGGVAHVQGGTLLAVPQSAATANVTTLVSPDDGSVLGTRPMPAAFYERAKQMATQSATVSASSEAIDLRFGSKTISVRSIYGGLRQTKDGYASEREHFWIRPLRGGGVLVLHRLSVPDPQVVRRVYPRISLPGNRAGVFGFSNGPPYRSEQWLHTQHTYNVPYAQLDLPVFLTDSGVAAFALSESPPFEESPEPFISAFPFVRLVPSGNRIDIAFDDDHTAPTVAQLHWSVGARKDGFTTYEAEVPVHVKSMRIALPAHVRVMRTWFRGIDGNWHPSQLSRAQPYGTKALLWMENAKTLVIETDGPPPGDRVELWDAKVPFVDRYRWSAFAFYAGANNKSLLMHGLTPALQALNDELYALRDTAAAPHFSLTWREALQRAAFAPGRNILNPKFWDNGASVSGDPLYALGGGFMSNSVGWTTDDLATQAFFGGQLLGLKPDPRYAAGVRAFYERDSNFYHGAFDRKSRKFTDSDTSDHGFVIGYNYLLSMRDLTDLVDSDLGLPSADVQRLVDRTIPTLNAGWIRSYPMEDFTWKNDDFQQTTRAVGMGRGFSEARLAYICGEWFARTRNPNYLQCEQRGLQLALEYPTELQGVDLLDGMDTVQPADALDAFLLAYSQTNNPQYLRAALTDYRELLLFVFNWFDLPETAFDDRAMVQSSFQSTFFDRAQGNFWRGDSWANLRDLWSLAKILRYDRDPRILWLLSVAKETHKESMPVIDASVRPPEQSDFYYRGQLDPNDMELMWEGLASRYSTKLDFTDAIWREAWMFESLTADTATVYRIPGTMDSSPGIALVRGIAGRTVKVRITASNISFAGGGCQKSTRLSSEGIALIPLVNEKCRRL